VATTAAVMTGLAGRYVDKPTRAFVADREWPLARDVARACIHAGDADSIVALTGTATLLCLLLRRPPARVVVLVAGTAGSAAMVTVLKRLTDRTGSYDVTPSYGPGGYAYPSGHLVAVLVSVGLVVWALGPTGVASRHGRPALVAGGLAGLIEGGALLLLQQHWLTDIVGAWALGMLWLLLCMRTPAGLRHVISVSERRRAVGPTSGDSP
jgi:undecaprenyl-diphosphatase